MIKLHLPAIDNPDLARDHQFFHQELEAGLIEKLQQARQGGGAAKVKLQHSRGKLTARERISYLQDAQTHFLELSELAGDELYADQSVACGGIITGVVTVAGQLCMIVANDQTVKGGAYFPITVKKHLRAQEIAVQNRLPCLYLVDSGGAYLPMQAELFADQHHFGRIFYNQAQMSALGIAQLSAVHGHCTAGGAYIPAMSDYTVMVKAHGRIFLGGPPLVKAATGETVTSAELGGWQVHSQQSGVVDAVADTEHQALDMLKQRVAGLPRPTQLESSYQHHHQLRPSQDPVANIEDLYKLMPTTHHQLFDPRLIIACLVDGSEFDEFKPNYGTTLVTGWAWLMGMPVGIVANHGVLYTESAQKATHFIDLCVADHRPLLFLQNIPGFMVGKAAESAGIAKYGAMMVRAVATAQVPKLTVIVGGSYGAGNYAMCGRAYAGDYVFTWPQARIGVMGSKQAWEVMSSIGSQPQATQASDHHAQQTFQTEFDHTTSPYYATARLWDDGLIPPSQTRKIVAAALASTLSKPKQPTVKGIVRQ